MPYHDLGPDHCAVRDKAKIIRRLVCRLRDLGCEVDARHAVHSLLIGDL
jgi:hypothetical protein